MVLTKPAEDKLFHCPNCGKPIDVPTGVSQLTCRHCSEVLAVFPENKIILANPIRTYIDLEGETTDSDAEGDTRVDQFSSSRKRRAAELAIDRIAQEKGQASRGLTYGILVVVFGGLLFLIALFRHLFLAEDWMNFAGFGLGLVFVPLGAYMTISFSLAIRTWSGEEAELKKEMVREEGAGDSG